MPGLLRGMARTAVVAGTATSVSNRVSRRQSRRWAAKDEPAVPAADYSQNPSTQPANTNEQIDQLRQLADLKDKGILTPAEFEQKKAQILAS